MGYRLSPTDTVNLFIKTMKDKKDAGKTKIKLTNAFKGVKPALFFGDDAWSGKTTVQCKIKLSQENFNQIVNFLSAPNRRVPNLGFWHFKGRVDRTI